MLLGARTTNGGHVVHLVAVDDGGIVINDPGGLALGKAKYLWNGGDTNAARREFDQFPDAANVLARRAKANPAHLTALKDAGAANFETFMIGAGKSVASNVLGWSVEEAAFAAHAVHGAPGIYRWADLSKLDPHTTTDIAQFIYDKSHGWFTFIVVSQAWRDAVKKASSKTMDDKKADPPATGTK